MFFITQIIQIIFLKKLGRTYTFPTIGFFSDLTLFGVSLYTLTFINSEIMIDINIPGVDGTYNTLRKFSNFYDQIEFKIEYLLSAMIVCLILKVTDII